MRLGGKQFLAWPNKRLTLLGMSGVGKTRLAARLPQSNWFHYSGDYRIGTQYLEEPILDNIKRQAMEVPFLHDLLRSDSIYICSNITVDNLAPISSFLGKLGNPELGGLPLEEFKRRQRLHREAEIAAMRDVPAFIDKASSIYGYDHFINDAGGSVCELDDESVLAALAENTVVIYLRTDASMEQTLIERARRSPKPLYFREAFLDEQLPIYLEEQGLRSTNEIVPDDFAAWVFPKLFHSRLPRYERIAEQYGYAIDVKTLYDVDDETDLLQRIAAAMDAAG